LYRKQAEADDNPDEWASEKILEDFDRVSKEAGISRIDVPVKEDWYWAFEHYGDDREGEDAVTKKDAPSPFAWSLLVGARSSDPSWKSLQDKVSKDLFGGDIGDDDNRALIATGMPSALRERFSGVLGEAKRFFSRQLPEVFGRTEGS